MPRLLPSRGISSSCHRFSLLSAVALCSDNKRDGTRWKLGNVTNVFSNRIGRKIESMFQKQSQSTRRFSMSTRRDGRHGNTTKGQGPIKNLGKSDEKCVSCSTPTPLCPLAVLSISFCLFLTCLSVSFYGSSGLLRLAPSQTRTR